jgi:hypothetical protein
MDAPLTDEEHEWLQKLDTDEPVKPEAPPAVHAALVEKGLAIELVEGGLQLTTLGRERLGGATPPRAPISPPGQTK